MKIADSNVTMVANRSYTQYGAKGSKNATNQSTFQSVASQFTSITAFPGNGSIAGGRDAYLPSDGSISGNDANTYSPASIGGTGMMGFARSLFDIQNSLLSILLGRTMGSTLGGMGQGAFGSSLLSTPMINGSYTEQVVSYQERESTSFSAHGVATTEDGRTINFGVDVMMSRSYMEYMNVEHSLMENALMDPLIINVGSDVTNISDQRFFFDLDGDGVEEDISMLGQGSGFLALDLNEDGVINDGSELFGTKSGDGFGDLRKYDSDGNGWIDENDDIFSKLKVWCKGENGEDILMDLKQADIGAIYLGEAQTEFSMYGAGGGRDAVVRSTGLFLRESSGSAGTVQHVDLALHNGAEDAKEEGISADDAETVELSVTPVENTASVLVFDNVDNRQNTSAHRTEEDAAERRAEVRRQRADFQKQQMEKRRLRRKEQREEMMEKWESRRREKQELLEKYIQHQQDMAASF